ncbi:Bax inhibitor-1/YccA family protein [Porphyrobacter sp. YT40]|uniref:Bax inhibitor-1/YccA family protein n=1 Tax=Porphyrobacter sp. YT40 TaxID=2547601 RepID=UPI0011413D74|nr:Bax inhibitor-1/YccA family protein [Porphyrobacter sp. YT40]QDH35596.1 Bax inhibitor-1/YccA family protein [Porphyrobacter sp. YT40]
MADWNDTSRNAQRMGSVPRAGGDVAGRVSYDEGLRKHMLSIYNYMTSGILLTGIVALLAFTSGTAAAIFTGGILRWIVALSPLAIVFAMSLGANRFSTGTLQAMFWAFSVLMGLSLSSVFLVYTGGSIATTFFATAAAFAGLSLYGYTTKRSLSGLGSFLIMGVIGLIVASVINLFLQSPAFYYAISFIGVLIFAGLTAYDTQRLKNEYEYLRGTEFAGKAVILGALSLYLDFINMFQFLLSFLGSRE